MLVASNLILGLNTLKHSSFYYLLNSL